MHRLPEEASGFYWKRWRSRRVRCLARVAFRASGIQENGPSLVSALRSANFPAQQCRRSRWSCITIGCASGIAARLKPGAVQAIHSESRGKSGGDGV